MIEQEWNTCSDPEKLLNWVAVLDRFDGDWIPPKGFVKASKRKLKLFVKASISLTGCFYYTKLSDNRLEFDWKHNYIQVLNHAISCGSEPGRYNRIENNQIKVSLLRCIFNPFFPPLDKKQVLKIPSSIRKIAQYIYDHNAWEVVGQLADILEEEGLPIEIPCPKCEGKGYVEYLLSHDVQRECSNCRSFGTVYPAQALLAHLRESGQRHTRGCWAVDWLLGRQ